MTTEDTSKTAAANFQTTHWSLLLAAAQPDSPQAQAALAALCEKYWYPVYAFIRRRGYAPDQAKDLTQDLFYRLLEKRLFATADPARGRFRSFLRTCAQNLINQQWRRTHALKRGGDCTFVSFDDALAERRYADEPATTMSPEKLFERRWVLDLLDQAMTRLKAEYARAGKQAQFEGLQVFLSGAKDTSQTYAEVGARLGVSESAARQAAHRMRSRFGDLFTLEVAQTVANPAELAAEINHLRAVLSE